MTNIPQDPRWDVDSICREFSISRATFFRRAADAGLTKAGEPNREGYSTSEVLSAVYGDTQSHKREFARLKTEEQKLRVAALKGASMDTAMAMRDMEDVAAAI